MAEARGVEAPGMVALRGELDALAGAVREVAGVGVPAPLRLEGTSGLGVGWMAPDELLLFLPRSDVRDALGRIGGALSGVPHLALDVSDMRSMLVVEGEGWREVLGKLSPADLSPPAFGPGAFRRTRLGQVAAAVWPEGPGAGVLCFRSVGAYALRLLQQSAADGPVGFYR